MTDTAIFQIRELSDRPRDESTSPVQQTPEIGPAFFLAVKLAVAWMTQSARGANEILQLRNRGSPTPRLRRLCSNDSERRLQRGHRGQKIISAVLIGLLVLTGLAIPTGTSGETRQAINLSEQQLSQAHAGEQIPMHTADADQSNLERATVLRPVTHGTRPPGAVPAQNQLLALAAFKTSSAPQSNYEPFAKPKDIVIDVIVAYTSKAEKNYLDIRRELVDLAIEEANESFRVSNLRHIKLRVVHAYQTDYVEEGAHFDHVWRFADKGDGYMDEIHSLRDKYHADVAVLIVDDPKGCGLATRVHANADEAFAVVHHECAAANYTLAHEVGHLIGASHDLSYANGIKWRDIMGSKESCGGCPRLPVWSSPMVLVNNEPAGTASHDNARVIAQQAARVAAFR